MSDRMHALLEAKGRHVETTEPQATVLDAIEQMNAKRIGALVVVEDGVTIGIFTERDVLVRVIACGCEPGTTRVADVMTTDPITITPETTLAEAMQVVTERRCRHLPVVDGCELVGLISAGDLTGWLVREQQREIYDLHDYIRAV